MSDSKPSNVPQNRLKADVSHSQQLLRDLALINARTVQQLGQLQPGAFVATPKRKPNLPRPMQRLDQEAVMIQNNDSSPGSMGKRPPVPQGLRESFKDYPDHIARLESALQESVDKPSPITPPLEFAIWAIEGCIDTFIDESSEKLRIAEQTGDQEAIALARSTHLLMLHSAAKGAWKGQNLMDYFGFPSSNPNGQGQRTDQDVQMTQENSPSSGLIGEYPPVPEGLQKIFQEYPGYMDRLKSALKESVDSPSLVTPPLEIAIWNLEGCLDSILGEVNRELREAEKDGDPVKLAAAEKKRRQLGPAGFSHNWKGSNMLAYFEERTPAPTFPGRGNSDMFKRDNEKKLLPPPVPQSLRELLADYPELIQSLQEVLDAYIKKPYILMPFEGAIWALEGRIGSFMSEASEELEAAYASGDPAAIERAEKKDFAVGYSRLNMGAMSDLASYFDGTQGHE